MMGIFRQKLDDEQIIAKLKETFESGEAFCEHLNSLSMENHFPSEEKKGELLKFVREAEEMAQKLQENMFTIRKSIKPH
jgi:hypothetical protein